MTVCLGANVNAKNNAMGYLGDISIHCSMDHLLRHFYGVRFSLLRRISPIGMDCARRNSGIFANDHDTTHNNSSRYLCENPETDSVIILFSNYTFDGLIDGHFAAGTNSLQRI